MIFRFRLACSFCGRSAAEVEKLVAGRRAFICDRCAQQTIRIMEASGEPPFETPPGLLQRIIARLWRRTRHPRAFLVKTFAILVLLLSSAWGQTKPPSMTIDRVAWLQGCWESAEDGETVATATRSWPGSKARETA